MSRNRNALVNPISPPLFERLESRTLMSFVPVITAGALVATNRAFGIANTDANLVAPRGITVTSNDQLWIANTGSGTVTTYNAAGVAQPSVSAPLVGAIPSTVAGSFGTPTGVVSHSGKGFDLTLAGKTGSSAFLFATEDGIIAGYNASVDPAHAASLINHSSTGDVFKGLAILGSGTGARIYATDFHNGAIEVFKSNLQQIPNKGKAFLDLQVPSGYAPFGIQAMKGKLYVTYARQDANRQNDNPGPAQGIIDIFSASGHLVQRVATGGDLNSPWGMALAPSNWGVFKNDLLVSNDGDGTISVYNKHGQFVEQVQDTTAIPSIPLSITGLWGLSEGVKKSRNTIFFTSDPNSGARGVVGALTATRPKRK